MKRGLCLGTLLALGGLSVAAAAYHDSLQVPQRPASIAGIQKVRDNLYWIPGGDPTTGRQESGATFSGGNVAVFVTDTGVVVVDTMLAGRGQLVLEQIRTVTSKPVTTIINTHAHFDHAGSNTEFPAQVDFVAHENTKAYWSKQTCSRVTNCDSFKGDNAKFLPKKTFKDKMSLFSGNNQIDLYHFGAGHTGGDTFVVFPAVRAMHSGDIFGSKWVPYIDAENGGSGVAYPQTLAKAVAGIKNVDTIITGHMGSLRTWGDLKEFAAYTGEFLTMMEAGMRAGKSVDEMAAGYKAPAGYYDLGGAGRVKDEIQDVYNELMQQQGR